MNEIEQFLAIAGGALGLVIAIGGVIWAFFRIQMATRQAVKAELKDHLNDVAADFHRDMADLRETVKAAPTLDSVRVIVDERCDSTEERFAQALQIERDERTAEVREMRRVLAQGLKDIRQEVSRAISGFGQLVKALTK